MAKTDVKVKIKPNTRIAEPSMYQIIYLNDDVTSMEFVITSLVRHFNHSSDTALELTQHIHEKGSATVAVLPYEVAEQKGVEVTLEAKANGFPLKVKIESEKI